MLYVVRGVISYRLSLRLILWQESSFEINSYKLYNAKSAMSRDFSLFILCCVMKLYTGKKRDQTMLGMNMNFITDFNLKYLQFSYCLHEVSADLEFFFPGSANFTPFRDATTTARDLDWRNKIVWHDKSPERKEIKSLSNFPRLIREAITS